MFCKVSPPEVISVSDRASRPTFQPSPSADCPVMPLCRLRFIYSLPAILAPNSSVYVLAYHSDLFKSCCSPNTVAPAKTTWSPLGQPKLLHPACPTLCPVTNWIACMTRMLQKTKKITCYLTLNQSIHRAITIKRNTWSCKQSSLPVPLTRHKFGKVTGFLLAQLIHLFILS